MVLRLGPQPDFPSGSPQKTFNPELARDIAAALFNGQSEEMIRFRFSQNHAPADVSEYLAAAKNNPFFQGAMSCYDELHRQRWITENQRKAETSANPDRIVPRRHKLAPETFLREHFSVLRPVVLTGLIDHWPALNLWNADYLEARIGRHTLIELQKGRSENRNFEIDKVRLQARIPFGDFADFLRSGVPSNDMYVTANNGAGNRKAFDPIWSDFSQIDGYTRAGAANDGFLWLGPNGTLTPFHHDLTHNLLIQVAGRKRVHMVPTFEDARMKPFRKYFSGWSLEDLQAQTNGPPVYETEIGPGDALFIPVGWWHHVTGLSESYSVLFTSFVWPNDYGTPYMLTGK